jgi:hypothetical protein
MRKYLVCCGVLVLAAAPARAEAPKQVKETWDAAYLEGAKAGFVHTLVQQYGEGDAAVLRTVLTMDLRIRRYNAVVPLHMQTVTDETPAGRVVGVGLTQFLDKGRLVVVGRVENGELVVQSNGETRRLPWDPEVIGSQKQDNLLREKKAKPGDKFTFRSFEPGLMLPATVRVAVKEPEEVDVLRAKKAEGGEEKVERVKQRLLRAETAPDKVEVGGQSVPLPRLVTWLDRDYEALRGEMELPGLGRVTLYRTTPAVAREGGAAPALMPDLGLTTLIPLNRPLADPLGARSVTYRVTLKGDDDPASAFVRDDRQQAADARGDTFELTVRGSSPPAADDAEADAKPEYLKSNYFLDSDDEQVRDLAARAAGREADPWRKALLIEKWVHENMRGSNSIGFATAGQVARGLSGDCRQHAMLAAAMCRAVGVPARTAVGLVYADDPGRGPVLAFHMWTEVFVKGRWHGLDATLGRGRVGAGHLKIGDHSWHNTQTLAPLLPVTRVMGRAKVEVVRVDDGK